MNKCDFCNYSYPNEHIIHGWDCSLKDQTTTRVRVCGEALQNMAKYVEIRAKNDANKIEEPNKTEVLNDLKLTLNNLYYALDDSYAGSTDLLDTEPFRYLMEKYGWSKEDIYSAAEIY